MVAENPVTGDNVAFWAGPFRGAPTWGWSGLVDLVFSALTPCSRGMSFPRVKSIKHRTYFQKGGITLRQCFLVQMIYATNKYGKYHVLKPVMTDKFRGECRFLVYCSPTVPEIKLYLKPERKGFPQILTMLPTPVMSVYEVTVNNLDESSVYIWAAYVGNSPRDCTGRTGGSRVQSGKMFPWWRYQYSNPIYPNYSQLWTI